MTHVEFEYHFTEQAERFGIAKIIRQRGEEYAFHSFMLAMSGIVVRNEPINEEKLDSLAKSYAKKELGYTDSDIANFNSWSSVAQAKFREVCEDFKVGYRKAWGG